MSVTPVNLGDTLVYGVWNDKSCARSWHAERRATNRRAAARCLIIKSNQIERLLFSAIEEQVLLWMLMYVGVKCETYDVI